MLTFFCMVYKMLLELQGIRTHIIKVSVINQIIVSN